MVNGDQVKHVEKLLNNKPVRKINYKTPNQILLEKLFLLLDLRKY